VYEPGQVLSWWTERTREIHERYPKAKWFADPSQPASIETLRREAGINIVKADNTLEQGIACVADKLVIRGQTNDRWTRLYVDPSCTNTIREFLSYKRKRDPHDQDRFLEQIVKRDDNCMGSARYCLFGYFGLPPRTQLEWSSTTFG
jgi:hypothetical protein